MIQITRWRPDTCECVIEYSWDDTLPEDQRTHELDSVVKKCQAHQALDTQEVYDTVIEENPRKNITLEEIKKALPSLTETVKQPDGTNAVVFKTGLEPQWTFDAQRNLEITIPTATANDKFDISSSLTTIDAALAGKVVIK